MNPINIKKRIDERTSALRRAADDPRLPAGIRLLIINNCDKLGMIAKKADKYVQTGNYRHAAYDARTQEDMAEQARHKKEVWNALLAYHRVSLHSNFKTSEFHTIICKIRHEIEDKRLPFVLCDEWVRPDKDRRPYKEYWLEDKKEGPDNE